MVAKMEVPVRGGVYMTNFDPSIGHEQGGFRPAVVISDASYNQKVGMALICPITSTRKGYPFEVYFETKTISGVILTDQIKSVDWHARRLRYTANLASETLAEVQAKIVSLVQ
ncbi:type II toxin-antitoxin system PemK/MazF family toxin [Candidatus Kaiserbacteria bacterium]|nr:type II toxin-antitoxin system PemK/MazF family toxin [Candidatus Kaiserbacteria bacterium]